MCYCVCARVGGVWGVSVWKQACVLSKAVLLFNWIHHICYKEEIKKKEKKIHRHMNGERWLISDTVFKL